MKKNLPQARQRKAADQRLIVVGFRDKHLVYAQAAANRRKFSILNLALRGKSWRFSLSAGKKV
jgi:hypothetical protein